MADLGDAFLSSLQTGLNIARSYRDESRLNDEIERRNRRDALLDRLAMNQDARAAAAEARLQDTYGFEKSRRPSILKADELGLQTSAAQLQGINIDNEWKPRRYSADVEQSRASAASSRASADYTRAQTRRVGIETQIASINLSEALRSREVSNAMSQMMDPSFDTRTLPKSMVRPLLAVTGLTQAAQTAQNVLGQVARGDWSWAQNANTVKQVQTFLRPEARRSAAQQGFDPNTSDITSFSLAKNGVVVNYAARDRNGNFVRWSDTLPADRLAAKIDIAGGAANALRSNPTLRGNIVSLYQQSDPQGYRALVGEVEKSIDAKIQDLRTAAKAPTAEGRQAAKDLATLTSNREGAIKSQVLNYLGVVGMKLGDYGDNAGTAVAFSRRVTNNPSLGDDEAIKVANTAVNTVRGWVAGKKVEELRRAGLLPKSYRDPKNTFEYLQLWETVNNNPRAANIVTKK